MKRYAIAILLVLFLAGNVYQALNPRVETVETIKWKTEIQKDVKIVEVVKPDGTRTTTTIDLSTTRTDKDSSTQTKPKPLPLNSIYLGINPRVTTDLELVYSRRVFGPLSAYASGSADLAVMEGRFHVGVGIQF